MNIPGRYIYLVIPERWENEKNKKIIKERDFEYKIIEEVSIDEDIYDRQKRIKGWDQKKISNASVMVIGAGATGNEVVKNLVLFGVGKIFLIDYDYFETYFFYGFFYPANFLIQFVDHM